MSARTLNLVLSTCLLAVACAPGGPGASSVNGDLPPARIEARPDDGLLDRPELQTLVDHQVARDGAALARALSDADAAVRARAAYALASVQDGALLPAVLPLLSDADASVRRDAAFAVGQTGADAAVDPITAALATETDPTVRRRLYEALGKIPTGAAAEALLAAEAPTPPDEAARSLALAHLMAVGGVRHQPAQDHLLARLDDPDADVRWGAAYYFGRQPEPGLWVPRVARVRQALDGYDLGDPAAMQLAQALGRIADPVDSERLAHWASAATDWRTRFNATASLSGRDDPGVVEALFLGLDDASTHVAAMAAEGLSLLTHPPSMMPRLRSWIDTHPDAVAVSGPLIGLLARQDEREFVFEWIDRTDPTDDARVAVGVAALSVMRGQEATERLIRAADAPSDVVAAPAVGGLVQQWRTLRRDPSTHARFFELFRTATLRGSARISRQSAPALADSVFGPLGNVAALTEAYRAAEASGDVEAMIPVLAAFGITRVRATEELLREAMRYPHQGVRDAAAVALTGVLGRGVSADTLDAGSRPRSPRAGVPEGADPGRIDWAFLAEVGAAPRLVLETEEGRVVVRLSTLDAPHTVQTIVRLAEAGLYDDVAFHRVVSNFVAQGGDFARGDGNGGPGYAITSEFTLITFERGVIGMASAGKDTEGSQFFINHVATPHLDGRYTAFGVVVEGMDVVDALLPGSRIVGAHIERSR